jgi:EmrB/QacA subfamily drug resistance transporter
MEQRLTTNLKWYTLLAACFALFMAILDNLVVNVALPTITRELDASTTQLQWIISAYTLVFASLQITAGGLGDRFGRKRWFLIGVALFTVTSLLAAFAGNIETLIAARALQGLGAALIMPLSLSLISDAFPPEERGKALGIWSAVSISGLALGPIVGGTIVEYAAWNWIFLINVPVGIAAFVVTALVVRESRDTSGTVATDIPGTVLITAAIGALTWGLIEAGNRGWGDRLIVTALAAAAALGAAFVWVESRTARPMVPLRFFRSSTFTGANIVAFSVAFAIAGVSFFWTLYQQNIHGYSAVRTGASLLPLVLVMMAASPVAGVLIGRVGPSRLIALGMTVSGVGVLLYRLAGVDAPYWAILPSLVVMGFGNSLIFAPMTTAVLNSVESAKSGVASAVNGAVREIGFAFGIALLGSVLNRVYQDRFDGSTTVAGLRSGPESSSLAPVLDTVGSGAGFAGRVVEDTALFPGLSADVAARLREVSAEAFMAGMDRAVLLGAAVMFAAAFIALVTVKDRVVNAVQPAPALVDEEREEFGIAAD